MRVFRDVFIFLIAAIILAPTQSAAQTPQRGKLTITVADQTGAVIPNVTVTLDALEAAAKATPLPPVKTTDKGAATFDDLAVGRYSARAEFPGFKMGLLRDFRVNRGDNKHVVVLVIEGLAESVTVGAANQGADRASRAFGLTVNQEQIEALSDDPDEMARQLNDIAGPGAIVRIDSFEGQQLPPKSQIKSIHVTRDQFAAETEQPGSTFVDVITQPGVGPIRGTANGSFRDGSMSAKSRFTPTKGPEQIAARLQVGGASSSSQHFSIGVTDSTFVTRTEVPATEDSS